MYLVTAILKPHRLEEVTSALKDIGVNGVTVTEAQGFGRQRGHTEVYRGTEYQIDFTPKIRLEVLCEDDQAEPIVEEIIRVARTGKIGDGKVWVLPVKDVRRIRTGELGPDAL